MSDETRESAAARERRVGLCASCAHVQSVVSSRGSEFLLCGRSKTDPRYPKYPPLPVRSCPGFERTTG